MEKLKQVQQKRLSILKSVYLKKRLKNPRFSIRAFAGQLEMSPGALSQMFTGKRTITESAFARITEKLGLELEFEISGNLEPPSLSSEQFAVLSKWYYFVILELTHLPEFQPDHQWISKVLNLDPIEAQDAIERLFRLGLLEKNELDQWVDSQKDMTTLGTVDTNAALKNYQSEIIDYAKHSLFDDPVDQRDFSSLTISFNSKDLEKVRQILKKARREINALSADQPNLNKDTVYQLSMAFFPLAKMNKVENKK